MATKLILPAGFPRPLAARAFRLGYMNWPTWSLKDGIPAIEALRSLSLAICSGTLGVQTAGDTQTHYTTKEGSFYYDFSLESGVREKWPDFVQRSCDTATRHFKEFTPHYPIIDPQPFTVGFMIVWESEDSHEKTKKPTLHRTRHLGKPRLVRANEE